MKSLMLCLIVVLLLGGTTLLGTGPGTSFIPEEDPWEEGSDGFDMQPSDSTKPFDLQAPNPFDLLHDLGGLLTNTPIQPDILRLNSRHSSCRP
jgi:hypothetical protein